MKTKNILSVVFMGLFLFGAPLVNAQQAKKKNSRAYRDSVLTLRRNNLDAVFTKLLMDAVIKNPAPTSSCQPNEIVKKIDQLLKKDENIQNTSTINLINFVDIKAMEPGYFRVDLPKVDKGGFKTEMDKMLNEFEKAERYTDFVTRITGDNLGALSKAERKKVRDIYLFLKYTLTDEQEHRMDLEKEIRFDDCIAQVATSMKTTAFEYPNITYELKISIYLSCNCSEGKGSLSVKSGVFDYIATSKGIYSGSVITFGNPINPHIAIRNIYCCPDDTTKKTEETALANPEKEETVSDSDFIKDTHQIFLTPDAVNQYRNYVVKEETSRASFIPEAQDLIVNDDPPLISLPSDNIFTPHGSSFFTLGAQAGVPIGDEADFFGFAYGAEVGYFYDVSKKFEIGATTGYTYYTGKETDFGFQTKGEGFIPITAKGSYNFSDSFGVEAGLGYAISTGGGEGGFVYNIGPVWRPLQNFSALLGYINIAFGEGSLGAFILTGRISLQKRQRK